MCATNIYQQNQLITNKLTTIICWSKKQVYKQKIIKNILKNQLCVSNSGTNVKITGMNVKIKKY